MEPIVYAVKGGLSPEQLARLHRAALRVLEEIGLNVEFPEMLKAIAGQPGVRIRGQNVRFEPAAVEALVAAYRAQRAKQPPASQDFSIDILSGYAFHVVDIETGAVRPMSTSDCIQMAKLVDGLHDQGVVGGTPGMPQDVPVALREVLAYKISCEQSRTSGHGGFTSLKVAETIERMAEVCGKGFSVPVLTLDPLRVAGDAVAIALDYVRRGRPACLGISTMPIVGLSSPITLPGAFVENVATVLGTFALFKLMGVPNEMLFHFDAYPFDMKWASMAYGTPEHILSHLLGAQINRYYDPQVNDARPFHTNAVTPDSQAQVQRASFAAVAALAGARRFTFGGMLGIDKVFSAEQLLIDVEIVNHVRVVARGFAFSEEALAVEAIREVGPGGSFITHPSTLERYRDSHVSRFFANLSPETWMAEARKPLAERFRAEAKRLIAAHDFRLEAGAQQELDRIYQAFADSV